ncbi:MAG TPA: S-layer homology domain-containing protein [Chloroflexia bacterium]|nr:S-layer homology domain-containing protein [Chloroflexia bacterium]
MKRAIISLVILLSALISLGMAASAAVGLPADIADATGAQTPHKLIGYAGKIIAVKPPGDWTQGGGPVDTSLAPALSLPLTLPAFGTDIRIASSNETFMASDPTNPLYFISGSNGVSRDFTSDGGQTWTTTSPSGIGDPVGTYDDAGNAYFGQLSSGTCPDPIVVSRSANGGLTWGNQITALSDASPGDHFIDKPWMTADNSASSSYHGRIYVTGTSFYAPGCNLGAYINNRMVTTHSTDQGATWSAPVTFSDASHDQGQFSNPVVASDGTLYVSYQYQNCTYNCTADIPMIQLLTKSTDGGVTFSPSMTITGQPITPTGAYSAGYQYLYAGSTSSGFRHNDQAIIGVSPSNPQHVYAIWTDGRFESSFVYHTVSGQHADVVFSRSTDGGATWSAVSKVNDDNVQGKDQFFPWMTVGNDGTIHASWMDRREAAVDGYPYREYYSQSTDEGQTWSANQPVGDVTNTPGSFIGDYSGLAVNADNSRVLPVWTDQRAGQGVYTDHGLIGGGGTPTNTPTSTPTNTTPPTDTSTSTSVPTQTPGGSVTPQPTPTCSIGGALYDIAIVFSDDDPSAKLISYIEAEPDVASVVPIDARFNTPDLATLLPYDEVVLYSNTEYQDPVTLGNVIADYQDAGGIVVATNANWWGPPYGLDGRWMTGGYTMYNYPATANTSTSTLGTYDSNHPLMQGVTSLTAFFRTQATLTTGAVQVAAWADSFPLVAYKTTNGHTAVGINAYLGFPQEGWDGDFGTLIVNAVRWLKPATACATATPGITDTPVQTVTGTPPTATETPTSVAGSPTETPTVCTLSFEDVPPDHTFYAYIQCLACRGIINGYPCGGTGEPCNGNNDPYFRPGNNVTRGQFAKIASNSAGFNDAAGPQQYEDVLPGSTFYDFIWRLTNRGFINGYPCGGPGEPCGPTNLPYFRPNANVTRGQLSKIDANAAGLTQTPGAQQFEDVLPGSTFYDFIWRLTDLGYMNGYPCGGVGEPCGPNNLPYFRPSANATRGQASKIVSNTFFPECQP